MFKSYGNAIGRGKWVYSASMSELLVIDVSNPVSPKTVNIIDMQKVCDVTFRRGNVTSYLVLRGVEVVGDYLAVVYTWDGDFVSLLSLKDPLNPRLVKKDRITKKWEITDFVLSDGEKYLYIFRSGKKLTIYKVEIEESATEPRFPESPQSAFVIFEGDSSGWFRVIGDVKVYVDGEFVGRLRKGQSVEVSGKIVEISVNLSDETARYFYFNLPKDKSCLIRIHDASSRLHRIVEFECRLSSY